MYLFSYSSNFGLWPAYRGLKLWDSMSWNTRFTVYDPLIGDWNCRLLSPTSRRVDRLWPAYRGLKLLWVISQVRSDKRLWPAYRGLKLSSGTSPRGFRLLRLWPAYRGLKLYRRSRRSLPFPVYDPLIGDWNHTKKLICNEQSGFMTRL